MFKKTTVGAVLGIDKQVTALNAFIEDANARHGEISRKLVELHSEDATLGAEVAKAKRAIAALSNI